MTAKQDPVAEKARIEAEFQADMQKAQAKRMSALAKFPSDNIAEEAWNGIKGDDDLPFAQCPPDLREKLEYQAADVIKTGIANTAFELKVAELNGEKRKAAKA